MNPVYANISKTTSPTSDSFLLIMSHIMVLSLKHGNQYLITAFKGDYLSSPRINPTNADTIVTTNPSYIFTRIFPPFFYPKKWTFLPASHVMLHSQSCRWLYQWRELTYFCWVCSCLLADLIQFTSNFRLWNWLSFFFKAEYLWGGHWDTMLLENVTSDGMNLWQRKCVSF